MKKIAIICPSEIAYRRFLPALKAGNVLEYAGVGVASSEEWFGDEADNIPAEKKEAVRKSEYDKAIRMQSEYGGRIYESYKELLESPDIDAVYLPLPPALHFKWAMKVLENGKHLLVEKPSTTCLSDTETLLKLAEEKGLAVHENYMFMFHEQITVIDELVSSGELGDVRLYRIDFGFPMRPAGDFRYMKALGGGALLDCGGYVMKYADHLLGGTAEVVAATANYTDDFDVDLYGSAYLRSEDGVVAEIGFGMDNEYRCSLEVWGSKGRLISDRVLTAPAGFVPKYTLIKGGETTVHELPADDTFRKSIGHFAECMDNPDTRAKTYKAVLRQETLVDQFMKASE
jgi:Predicted dehydrogenases and related proteins